MEQTLTLDGHIVRILGDEGAADRLVMLGGDADAVMQALVSLTQQPFLLVCAGVSRWNDELSPWPAEAVFGSEGFGDGAEDTLRFVTDTLLPMIEARWPVLSARYHLAGYSLAGLFALWSAAQCDRFSGVAAVSPSVWFPGWRAFRQTHPLMTPRVYLSLGDKEARTRHPLMSTVADAIRAEQAQLISEGAHCILVWNPGNHFRDSALRTAKGLAWLLEQ